MEYDSNLRVWSSGREWFVAASWEGVQMLYEDHIDPFIELDRDDWSILDPDDTVRIRYSAEEWGMPDETELVEKIPPKARELPEFTHRVEAKAAAWADHTGECFLSSLDY